MVIFSLRAFGLRPRWWDKVGIIYGQVHGIQGIAFGGTDLFYDGRNCLQTVRISEDASGHHDLHYYHQQYCMTYLPST